MSVVLATALAVTLQSVRFATFAMSVIVSRAFDKNCQTNTTVETTVHVHYDSRVFAYYNVSLSSASGYEQGVIIAYTVSKLLHVLAFAVFGYFLHCLLRSSEMLSNQFFGWL